MRSEVVENIDDFNRKVWTFYLDDRLKMRLVRYSEENRATKRHSWKIQQWWDYYERRSVLRVDELAEAPKLTQDIIFKATQNFASHITLVDTE